MSERPILFNGAMVRAIIAGRKTQTRRVVDLRPPYVVEERDDGSPWPYATTWSHGDEGEPWMPCPFGGPGDRLWIREAWGQADSACEEWGFWRGKPNRSLPLLYRADGVEGDDQHWRPSIYMPRWASRLTLLVTGVRVERLRDISEADALAEGVAGVECDHLAASFGACGDCMDTGWVEPPEFHFASLWDSIGDQPGRSWGDNPWVWVVSFEVLR